MEMIFFAHGESGIFPGILIYLTLYPAIMWTVIAAFRGKRNVAMILCAVIATGVGGMWCVQFLGEMGLVYSEDIPGLIKTSLAVGSLFLLGLISLVRIGLNIRGCSK